jgi:DNA-binding MarR family transcriptional regulator
VDLSAFHKLDRVIHEKGRLAIMSLLAATESLTFKELRDLLEMTDGNLSVHMRTLEESGYISVRKDFVKRKPQTTYALTAGGRAAFAEHIEALESIIEQSRRPQKVSGKAAPATAIGGALRLER